MSNFHQNNKFSFTLNRIKTIEYLQQSPQKDSSPELSESFEIYLEQRKKKAAEEKIKLQNEKYDEISIQEHSVPDSKKDSIQIQSMNETLEDESFLELEKLCENTLTLNNVSEMLTDLTTMDSNESHLLNQKKKSLNVGNETHINEIEEPSFFFNNTSLASPYKHSPFKKTNENRPSPIMEVTETSLSSKTTLTSYRTANGTSTTADRSEYYQTANETLDSTDIISAAKKNASLKSFYNEPLDFTKDSLEMTSKSAYSNDITADSLNSFSFDKADASDSIRMNDTLEEIEYMLAQAEKMNTPKIEKYPQTPKIATSSYNLNKPSPTPWSATKFNSGSEKSKLKNTPTNFVSKNSPLMKFSPNVNGKSPVTNFKLPKQPASLSKIPQISVNNKKFQHIASPISRYINQTPELPLSTNARVEYGYGNPRTFNFRDSENFSNQNKDTTNIGSSLPLKAKTKSSSVKKVRLRIMLSHYQSLYYISCTDS